MTRPKDESTVPLDPRDVASWAALLPIVRVGGALPVTFRADGEYVLVDVTVPYVGHERLVLADPRKVPLAIADGFPVPVTARYRLPPYSPVEAPEFLRRIVQEIYYHEIDEQLRVDDSRPFAPNHD